MYTCIELYAPGCSWLCVPAVFMDGLQLKMRPSETQQQHVLDDLDGSSVFSLNWDLHFPELGNTVEITTAFMRVIVWLSPEILPVEVSRACQLIFRTRVPLLQLWRRQLCHWLLEQGACMPCARLAGQA